VTVRLAVVDDSSFVRKAIVRLFADDPRIEVVGSAASGEELLSKLHRWRPDVVTLDLSMPGMGGLQTLDRVMVLRPMPVIILSTHAGEGAPQTIEALHRGAADFIDKQHYSLLDFDALRDVLTQKILAVTAATGEFGRPGAEPARSAGAGPDVPAPRRPFDVLLLGASTGGPPAIEQVLSDLGVPSLVPIVVVQHMPVGFTSAFAHRLNAHLAAEVREAEDGGLLRSGSVSIAPAGQHLRLARGPEGLRAVLGSGPDAAHKPSIDELFLSAAREVGKAVVAVLLTGMGSDGALGLQRLRQAGAYTIAQDQASSVVWGMPGAAVALGAASECLALPGIGPRLRDLLRSGVVAADAQPSAS
jgi:two-component system, chemotaxis family, protein-glutamate methylesterase/glutaminase